MYNYATDWHGYVDFCPGWRASCRHQDVQQLKQMGVGLKDTGAGAVSGDSRRMGRAWTNIVAAGLITKGAGAAAAPELDAPTVVFSRSRAPGIAANFDTAVANGAPTVLNRIEDRALIRANRRAALRGQAAPSAGQSLDEYPFACTAQGGLGACVRPVSAGEQSYQGGVLSTFFQQAGIFNGDPFEVRFGP
jgi:hypothetical protein